MIYEVRQPIKVKTQTGEAELSPGQLIQIDPPKAKRLVEMGKIQLHMTEARLQSLYECMDAIWDSEVHPFYRQGFPMTHEIAEAEDAVVQLQEGVSRRLAKLEDYRKAVLSLKAKITTDN